MMRPLIRAKITSDLWQVPTFPLEPLDAPSIEVVDDAYLTRVEHGPLRTFQVPHFRRPSAISAVRSMTGTADWSWRARRSVG